MLAAMLDMHALGSTVSHDIPAQRLELAVAWGNFYGGSTAAGGAAVSATGGTVADAVGAGASPCARRCGVGETSGLVERFSLLLLLSFSGIGRYVRAGLHARPRIFLKSSEYRRLSVRTRSK